MSAGSDPTTGGISRSSRGETPAFAAQTPATPTAGDSSKIIALPSPAVEHPQLGETLKALRIPKKTHAEAISCWLTDLETKARGLESGVLWAVWLAARSEPRVGSLTTAQHLTVRNERLSGVVEDRLDGYFSSLAATSIEEFLTGARTFEALVTEIIPVRWFDPLRPELEKALKGRLASAEQAQVLEACRTAVAELHHRLAPTLLGAWPAGTRAGQDASRKMYLWLTSSVMDLDSEAELVDWIRSAFEAGGDGGSPARVRRGRGDDTTPWAIEMVPVPVAGFRGLTVADLVLLARVTLNSLREANKITASTLGRRFHLDGESGEMLFRAVVHAVLQCNGVREPRIYVYLRLQSSLRESRNAALGVSRHMQEVLKRHAEDEPCNPKSVKKALQAQALAHPLSLDQMAEEDPAALDRISSSLAAQPSLMANDELDAASCLLRRALAEAGLARSKLARGLELLGLHVGRGKTFAEIAALGRFGRTEESVKKQCARFKQTVVRCLSGPEQATVRAILESDWLGAMLQDKGWEWLLPSSPPAPGQPLESK